METKKCIKCGIEKELNNFRKQLGGRKIKKYYYRSNCKECEEKYQKQYYRTSAKRREWLKKYYDEHKEYILEYQKKYRENKKKHWY